jgi:hypothetical protein
LSAIVGVPSSVRSSSERSVPSGNHRARLRRRERVLCGGARRRPLVDGTVAEAPTGHVGERRIGGRRVVEHVEHPEPAGIGDPAHDLGRDLPPAREREDLVDVLGLHDREHPLLALGGHHLDGVHPRLAPVHGRQVHVHAVAGRGGGLRQRTRQAGRTEVLYPDGETGIEQGEAGLDQALLLEGVAHLHRRALRLGALLEPGRREHARSADPVAPRGGAEEDADVADPFGAREHQPLPGEHADAHDVDERVVPVAVVEHHLTTHGGHSHCVPVAADARHHSLEQEAGPGIVERTEAQGIEEGDRAGPHREDVPDDAAHPRGGALVRLDRRRMVVALDPHGHGEAVPHVDDAGALARADDHPRRLGREPAQVHLGGLVRAVLRPHHGVHRELEVARIATQQGEDVRELGVGEAELTMQGRAVGAGGRFGHALRLPVTNLPIWMADILPGFRRRDSGEFPI